PKLLVASANPGKVRELKKLLEGLVLQVIGPDELPGPVPAFDEQGSSFCENAAAKARHWQQCTGMAALADDSGLEVEALEGAPGIRSARFAGDHATDSENVALLLEKLDGLGQGERRARFFCCLALCRPGSTLVTFTGSCQGRILNEPVGRNGFGYDPVFFYPPLKASFAQLGAREKNRVSHRARALEKLRRHLLKHGL
ncbi:MAG: RdgB/HAM1 family non-canonical purine NTP pyrophosphatase, partial [Candidatus Glassbacteria bacterium]|nr:RdgB/HAM1 family non-canonical purine NTP pyrophosphatase [Candidatus Glassbacteria bacterium]